MKKLLRQIKKKKRQLDSLKPLSVEQKKKLTDWMKVELTYNSIALEGNTLTRAQVVRIIRKEKNKKPRGERNYRK